MLKVFAKRVFVPSSWNSTLARPGGEKMHIDIKVSGLEPGLGDRLVVLLRQLVYVENVLTSVPPVELPRTG